MAALKDAITSMKSAPKSGKGKWYFGRRVKSAGAPTARHRRKVFWEHPADRCEKHHAYKANCGCGVKKER